MVNYGIINRMKLTIRRKILLAFGMLPVVLGLSGFWMLKDVDRLGRAIDVIMRENYRSVISCQKVNEALERVDSGLLYAFSGKMPSDADFAKEVEIIEREWKAELSNLTVEREKEEAEAVQVDLTRYLGLLAKFKESGKSVSDRVALYENDVYPLFAALKERIGGILTLNQERMHQASESARKKAERLFRFALGQFAACLVFLAIFGVLLTRWVQNPVRRLIDMAREIAGGNLSLAVDSQSDDEIGQLSRSFNSMAASLRTTREDLEGRLERDERIRRDVLRQLPLPIAVFDIKTGEIRLSTSTASDFFGWTEGRNLKDLGEDWLRRLFDEALQTGRVCASDEVIDRTDGGRRFLFRPIAVPLPTELPAERQTDVIVILRDAGNEIRRQDLKREAISEFSEQLRSPLADLRLSLHLLVEEKCGPLQPEQLDFILAMREDGEKLEEIITGVLDFHALNGGKDWIFEPCRPLDLLRGVQERFAAAARTLDQSLEVDCAPDLPAVAAVPGRIGTALDNLLDNALRFSPAGGRIVLAARTLSGAVEFSVIDSGRGMPPEIASRAFEPFFRGEGNADRHPGLGLSIVREIAVAHHGTVGVRATDGGGATVFFTLPIAREAAC